MFCILTNLSCANKKKKHLRRIVPRVLDLNGLNRLSKCEVRVCFGQNESLTWLQSEDATNSPGTQSQSVHQVCNEGALITTRRFTRTSVGAPISL